MHIYQEIGDRYDWTPKLLVGLAVCHMRQLNYDDAFKSLNDALGKDSNHADTLANLVVVCTQLGKPATRYQGMLESAAPKHPLL